MDDEYLKVTKLYEETEKLITDLQLTYKEVLGALRYHNDLIAELRNRQEKLNIIISTQDKEVFEYDETSLINKKYSNLKLTNHLVDVIDRCRRRYFDRYECDLKLIEFLDDNKHYYIENAGYVFCDSSFAIEIESVKKLRPSQERYYLYWRGEVLKGNFVKTDLGYLGVFVIELANYLFNENPAFVVSILDTLYVNYKELFGDKKFYIPYMIIEILTELDAHEEIMQYLKENDDIFQIYEEHFVYVFVINLLKGNKDSLNDNLLEFLSIMKIKEDNIHKYREEFFTLLICCTKTLYKASEYDCSEDNIFLKGNYRITPVLSYFCYKEKMRKPPSFVEINKIKTFRRSKHYLTEMCYLCLKIVYQKYDEDFSLIKMTQNYLGEEFHQRFIESAIELI